MRTYFNKLWRLNQPFQSASEMIDYIRSHNSNQLLTESSINMIAGVMQVEQKHVRDICVPSGQMVTIHINDNLTDIIQTFNESHHSRIPVYDDNKESILGILLAKDLLKLTMSSTDSFVLRDHIHPILFIPESKKLNTLLRDFQTKHMHMAIVLDEYGGVSGLVTIEDVIEQIVGEIDDEHFQETDQLTIAQIGDGLYAVKGITEIDEFNTYFKTDYKHPEVDTMGGLLTSHLGYIPKLGASIVYRQHQFEIKQADQRRIITMIVRKIDSV
ncbi:MAG: magnesium/cobalt efflux protein [Legionellales bacterium]|nr:magnesium/cobalt efflux protein [Legionellales bacterium]